MTLPMNFSPCGTATRLGRYGAAAAGVWGEQPGVTQGVGALFLQGKATLAKAPLPRGLLPPLVSGSPNKRPPVSPAEPSGTSAPGTGLAPGLLSRVAHPGA